MMTLTEFKNTIRKNTGPRKLRITNSYDLKDYYRAFRKQYGNIVSEKLFGDIVRTTNNSYIKDLYADRLVILPHKMGGIDIEYICTNAYEHNNELVVTYRINWDKTLELWYEDPEAYEQKLLVRYEKAKIRRPKYDKYYAKYTHQSYYRFFFARAMRHYIGSKEANLTIKPLHYG